MTFSTEKKDCFFTWRGNSLGNGAELLLQVSRGVVEVGGHVEVGEDEGKRCSLSHEEEVSERTSNDRALGRKA